MQENVIFYGITEGPLKYITFDTNSESMEIVQPEVDKEK